MGACRLVADRNACGAHGREKVKDRRGKPGTRRRRSKGARRWGGAPQLFARAVVIATLDDALHRQPRSRHSGILTQAAPSYSLAQELTSALRPQGNWVGVAWLDTELADGAIELAVFEK